MGWDASATRDGQFLAIGSRYSAEHWSIEDLLLREVFQEVKSRVYNAAGCTCEYLDAAQLSGSHDRIAFERAFGLRFDDIGGGVLHWSAKELSERVSEAQWVDPTDNLERPSYHAVKEFVLACARNNLGIHFSW